MTARIEPSLLGKMSERQVLHQLQARGPLSRAEVARHSGLSAPAVSRAVTALLRSALIEEVAKQHLTGGRPATRLRLARNSAQVLGVVVDADRCRVVTAGLDGQLHDDTTEVPTPDSYPRLIDALAAAGKRLMARGGVRTLGACISLPGLIDYRTGHGVLSPNLPITNGHAPAVDLGKKLGVECLLLHESHALCLAEQHHGQANGLDNFAMLDVHTGVGLGIVSGGRLLTGHSGLAGEIGHVTVVPDGRRCGCGNLGCLETVASDQSLAWRVSRRLGRAVSVEEALTLANEIELADVCHYLAVAVASVIHLFNPSHLFVHGRLFDADAGLFPRMIDLARQRTLRPAFSDCTIHRATAQKHQGAVAGIIQQLTSAVAPALETKILCFPTEVRHALPAT